MKTKYRIKNRVGEFATVTKEDYSQYHVVEWDNVSTDYYQSYEVLNHFLTGNWAIEDRKSFPVKYFVTGQDEDNCIILDTSFEGLGSAIAFGMTLETAHKICKLLNESEGFRYEY